MSDADTIRRLRAELDERDETIRQLLSLLKTTEPLPAWVPHLTATEEALLRVLMARELVTVATFDAVAPNKAGEESADVDNRLAVYVVKLRKKLAPVGVKILTLWGRGYALDRASVDEAAARAARFASASHHSGVQAGAVAA